jgi:hypothetical protein
MAMVRPREEISMTLKTRRRLKETEEKAKGLEGRTIDTFVCSNLDNSFR